MSGMSLQQVESKIRVLKLNAAAAGRAAAADKRRVSKGARRMERDGARYQDGGEVGAIFYGGFGEAGVGADDFGFYSGKP